MKFFLCWLIAATIFALLQALFDNNQPTTMLFRYDDDSGGANRGPSTQTSVTMSTASENGRSDDVEIPALVCPNVKRNFTIPSEIPKELVLLSRLINQTEFAEVAWITSFKVLHDSKMAGMKKYPCTFFVNRRQCLPIERNAKKVYNMSCRLFSVRTQALAMATNHIMQEYYDQQFAHEHGKTTWRGTEDFSKEFLLILTKSAPRNFGRRTKTRKTWLGLAQSKSTKLTQGSKFPVWTTSSGKRFIWFHLFVSGLRLLQNDSTSLTKQMLEEQIVERDLLLFPDHDAYRRLTWKVMWELTWVLKHRDFKYMLLLDDDSYVQFDLAANYIVNKGKSVYAGYITKQAVVNRNPASRWYVSAKLVPKRVFPAYAWGAGMFMSKWVAGKFLYQARWIPENLWFGVDDAFIGVLRQRAMISAEHLQSVHLENSEDVELVECDSPTDKVQFTMITTGVSWKVFGRTMSDIPVERHCLGVRLTYEGD